jgi:hypothetical protein
MVCNDLSASKLLSIHIFQFISILQSLWSIDQSIDLLIGQWNHRSINESINRPMNFLYFYKLVLQSFITNQVYKGKNLLGIFKLEDGTDVIYWSWIDTYLIITEERHPDQRFSWYSLTMTHIELSHCFDSTVLPNDLLDLSTFLFYYYKPIFYLRKLNSKKTPFTIQWPIIKSFKFSQITFHLNLTNHVQNHRISP